MQRKVDREAQYYRTKAKKILNQKLKEMKKSNSQTLTPRIEESSQKKIEDLSSVSRDLSQSFAEVSNTTEESKQEVSADDFIPDDILYASISLHFQSRSHDRRPRS